MEGWRVPVLGTNTTPVRGVDVAEEVEAVGKNVTRLRPGDEVFGTAESTFAEYATTSEDRLAPKPRQLSFAQAAAIGVAAVTALQGLRDKGRCNQGSGSFSTEREAAWVRSPCRSRRRSVPTSPL